LWQVNPGPQTAFLQSTAREVLYGGAVGGGKTDALLMCALRWIWHPKHRALILRRTRPQLQEMIDRSIQLYSKVVPGAQWKEAESRWKFPSGAVIQMGYAEHEKDIYQFKSYEYNLICFDELTTFTEAMYTFMFSRNRTKAAELPLMVRAGTNPGDIGHDWVMNRFIGSAATNDIRTPYKIYSTDIDIGTGRNVAITKQFIPSKVWDNPSLPNREQYVAGMIGSMPPEDVAAYLEGRWDMLAGAMFKSPLRLSDSTTLLDANYITIRAIDFGIDDPTCVLWVLYYPKTNVFDVVSELYLKDTNLDTVVHMIKKREEQLKLRPVIYSVGSPEMVARQAAASNQSIATIMATRGIPVERANADRLVGWTKVIDLTTKAAIRIWPMNGVYGAPNLMRTLPKLQRNSGPGKDPNDIRPRQEDHAADCLRYAVMAAYENPQVVAPPPPEEDNPNFDNTFDKMVNSRKSTSRRNYIPGLGEW